MLLITYGRIELARFPLSPFIAFIWIWGLWESGLQFNIVNIILSALIFGLGDDYSLFIMDGLLRDKTGKRNLSSYKSSIVLAITTLPGLVFNFCQTPHPIDALI